MIETTVFIKKYGGKIVVCQPGTAEVAKSKEKLKKDKGVVKKNNIANVNSGIEFLLM